MGLTIPAVVVILTILAFLPTFENGFVDWDDRQNFQLNESYRGLGWTQIKWMFSAYHLGHYIPVTWLTFGLDYLVWGMDPFGYHLTNLLLHAANAALVFVIATRLLARANPALAADLLGLRLAAGAAALLFSLHPLRVESVAWATERRDVLCGFFYLLAVLAYLRRCDAQSTGDPRGRRWYLAALAAFAAALLSKSMAVSLPAVLLVLDVYPLRRLTLTRGLLRHAEGRRVLAEKIPFVLLAAAAAAVAIPAVRYGAILTPMSELGVAGRLSLAVFSFAFYLWKMVVPMNLSALYERPDTIHWGDPSFALSGLVVVTMTLLAVKFRRRWPALGAIWASYIVMLLPVSGLVQNGFQLAADRYTYLPCLGWALLASGGLGSAWLHLRRTQSVAAAVRRIVPVVLVVSASLGALTWRQVGVWHDTETLWTHALSASPSAQPHQSLGRELVRLGRVTEALGHLQATVELRPRGAVEHYELAAALERLDRLPESAENYAKAVLLRPADAHFRNYLGVILMKQGRFDEAVAELRRAVALSRDSAEAHKNLGAALARQGRDTEAIEQFQEALRLSPGFAEAHEGLGLAFVRQSDLPRAIRELRAALKQSRDPAEVHNNLGVVLVRQGDPEGAVQEFRRAVELRPDLAAAQRNLDAALLEVESRRRR